MKKIFVLLALIFLVTGCTTLTDSDVEKVMDEVLTSDIDLSNQYFSGYQFYLPREVSLIDKFDYNTVLLYKSNKMYLYVDIISYYHKVDKEYEQKDNIYFSKVFSYNGKSGYINIEENNGIYYIEMEYNHGKIETYVEEKDLTNTIINCCYILKTLKYNDVVIDSLIGENKIQYEEERFDLFKSDQSNDDYLDIIDNHDNYKDEKDEKTLVDDDDIQFEDDSSELNN